MSAWRSYDLRDFLLFSRETYFRLFELYNQFVGPGWIVAVLAGLGIPLAFAFGGKWRGRLVSAILAAAWLWIAWGFHWRWYRGVHLAAPWFAGAFAVQGILVGWMGGVRDRVWGDGVTDSRENMEPVSGPRQDAEKPTPGGAESRPSEIRRKNPPKSPFSKGGPGGIFRQPLQKAVCHWLGWTVYGFALAGYPLLAPIWNRPWTQVELFALAPDPTAIGTLALLLLAGPRLFWALWIIPLLWLMNSALTLRAMGAVEGWAPMVGGGGLVLGGAWRTSMDHNSFHPDESEK
jgi:hypothetical protein